MKTFLFRTLPIAASAAIAAASPSLGAAIAAVRKLKADGAKNIDVGCMQMNLKYHPKAFKSLQDAFDPTINARYAANLFAKLRRSTRSITRAVAHYIRRHATGTGRIRKRS